MSTDRYATSIFCDDVRLEAGNKISYMGVYQSNMYLAGFPTVLPKFCIGIQAITPSKEPFEKLVFKVLCNDKIIASQSIEESILLEKNKTMEESGETIDDNGRLIFGTVIQLQPFVIDEPTKLSIRVDCGSEELKAISLMISLPPEPLH